MIERFLIDYNVQKVQAVRSAVGKYYVMLPEMIDFQGKKVDGIIARVNGAWSMVIGDRKSPDFLTVFLKDDKSVEIQRGNDPELIPARGSFNPFSKSETALWNYCKTIYDVADGIYAHEKLNIPTDKLNDIRALYLRAFVKLLGYGSVDKVKFGTSTCTPEYLLREIGEKLETYKSLTPFIHREMTENGDVVDVCEVTTDSDKAVLALAAKGIKQDGDDLISTLDYRIEELKARRKVNGLYCAKKVRPMNKEDYPADEKKVLEETRKLAISIYGVQYKDLTDAQKRAVNKKANEVTGVMTYDEFEDYMDTLERTAHFIMRLNYDLLEDGDKAYIDRVVERTEGKDAKADLTGISGMEFADLIYGFVDSPEFIRACNIEDRFVRSECENLERTLGPEIPGAPISERSILRRTVVEERIEREGYIRDFDNQYRKTDANTDKKAMGLDDSDDEPIY